MFALYATLAFLSPSAALFAVVAAPVAFRWLERA